MVGSLKRTPTLDGREGVPAIRQQLLRYCNTIPNSPHFPHDLCLWHRFSRCRVSTCRSFPYNNADPVPRGTGFFVPGNKAKPQNLLSYGFAECSRIVSAKASQMAARPAHPRNTTDRPPCRGALEAVTPDTLNSALCSIGPHTWSLCGGLFLASWKPVPPWLAYHSMTFWLLRKWCPQRIQHRAESGDSFKAICNIPTTSGPSSLIHVP